MRWIPLAVIAAAATPAAAAKPMPLTCAYTSPGGGKATIVVERAGDAVTVAAVRGDKGELVLRKGAPQVTTWEVNPYGATEIDFTATEGKTKTQGHLSFEKQEDIFRLEVKGAPPALRKALKLKGGWFVLVIRPGTAECQVATVGVATLEQDGSLHMQFRSIDHGMIAEALEVVKPGDASYEKYLKHLGGLTRGQSKPIPEFPPAGEVY